MNKSLPLNEPLELSISYLHKISVRSQIIYTAVLLFTILAVSSLPFIKVDISVRSSGAMVPAIEKSDIIVPINGHLSRINLTENMKVRAGDTLISIDPSINTKQYNLSSIRIQEIKTILRDIAIMDKTAMHPDRGAVVLINAQYRASWEKFKYELASIMLNCNETEREFKRYDILYRKKFISASEFEKYESNYNKSIADRQHIIKQYQSQWQVEAEQLHNELNTIQGKILDWKEQERYYTLLAPVSGSIQKLSGVQKGTAVFANQKLAELSPDSMLIAVCYVSPSDIGLLNNGQKVRFMIDAFDYNQWGVAKGSIIDISDDIVLTSDNRPVFKVKCQLNKKYLSLPGGHVGHIKKGMSFNASFLVNRRTLFELIYKKADQWVNPGVSTSVRGE